MITASPSRRAAFGRKSESYEAHAFVQKDAAQWLAEWLPNDAKALRCLEFGAGTGLLTEHLSKCFGHVEATDIESKMLAKCLERVPGVPHHVRDAWSPQTDDSQWDYVASSSLMQWATKPAETLAHWSQILKADSRMLLGFFIDPSLPEMTQIIRGEGPVTWRSEAEWAMIFEKSGLNITRMESVTHRYYYDSPLHFWKSLHGTGATVSQRLKPSQMLSFFRDYEAKYKTKKGVYATWTFCRAELCPGA